MKSIKTKLLVFLAIALLVMFSGLGVIAYQVSATSLIRNTEESVEKLATESAKVVESRLKGTFSTMEAIAVREQIESSNITVDAKLQSLKSEVERNGYKMMAIADVNGVSKSTNGVTVDLHSRDYFKKAIGGQPAVSDPISSKEDKSVVIAFAVPIRSQGVITGALIVVEDGLQLSAITNDITVGKTGKAFMLNKIGATIAHNKKELVLKADNDFENVKTDPKLKPLVELEKKMVNGEKGAGQYTYDGTTKYMGYAPVTSTGWSIAVTAPKSEVLGGLDQLKLYLLIGAGAILAIALLTIFIIIGSVTKVIKVESKHLQQISTGDLTLEVPEKFLKLRNEFGDMSRAMNQMVKSLRDMIRTVQQNSSNISQQAFSLSSIAEQMSSSSGEVASSIQEVAKGTNAQAQELSDITSVMGDFGTQLDGVVGAVGKVDHNSRGIGSKAEASNGQMQELADSVKKVETSFQGFVAMIEKLRANVDQIDEITLLINSIADQTNLLALNAAIEAARAGEAGKGFAVVADEIRKLAEQSKNSSDRINKLVKGISEDTGNIVNSSEEMNGEMEQQVMTIRTTLESFKQITEAVDKVMPQIEGVSQAVAEIEREKNSIVDKVGNLSAIAEEVSASSQQISASTEEMNASSEEVASSSQMLSDMIRGMVDEVGKFKI